MVNPNAPNKRELIEKIILWSVFICYLVLVVKILFLSRISLAELLADPSISNRSINLIPFYSIGEYLFSGSNGVKSFAFGNVAGNIIMFIPLGVFLPLIRQNKKVLANLLIIFAISLGVEVVQGLLGIGIADIDDIILNCLGGLAGILAYSLLVKLIEAPKTQTVIAIIAAVVGLPVMLNLLFFIKMRF